MKKINVFHIGFFHSASSLLQAEIFPRIPNFSFINENKQLTHSSVSLLPAKLGTDYYFENNKILNLLKNKTKNNSIFSSEAFTYFIEHPSFYKNGHLEDTQIAISNLSKYLSSNNDRILFIIRKQSDVVESYYRRWYHLTKNPDDIFLDFPFFSNKHKSLRTKKVTNFGMMYLRSFNYRAILSPLINQVSKKRIFIIPYEHLKKDKKKFLKLLGKAFDTNLDFLAKMLKIKYNSSEMFKYKLPKKFKNDLQKQYEDDNEKLDRVFKLNLKKLGYY